MYYTLPKIWLCRVQKYWDKIIPNDYPESNSDFSLRFDSQEIRDAVLDMENHINTEDSVIINQLPEDTYLSNYVGTYNVSGVPGERTLLSPEKVSSSNVVVMHYDGESWNTVEDVEVVDGYVWGTLDSFSPIAVFEYRKDIHVVDSVNGLLSSGNIVCEGNTVSIRMNDNNNPVVINISTGKSIEITKNNTYVVGGSVDGSYVGYTSIVVNGLIDSTKLSKIIVGSVYTGEGYIECGNINLTATDCTKMASFTGSFGAVRTQEANFKLQNIGSVNWFGCGEGFAKVGTPDASFASRDWLKKANWELTNVNCTLAFLGQNCEYFYVHETRAVVNGGKYGYFIMGGSNANTNETTATINNAEIGIFQTTNRGNVANAKVTFKGCKVDNLFVGGDATDSTVTGTTTKLRYEINAAEEDSYNIVNGTEAGKLLTTEDVDRIVDGIKVSRSANVTISDDLIKILGDKYIVK
jgi:hypothetical protein